MTDRRMLDPEFNFRYYAENRNEDFRNEKDRFKEERVRWVGKRLQGRKRVLDAACNDGFVSELIDADAEYFGVELNAWAIEHAYPRARGRIRQGNIVDVELPVAAFDAVVVMEVLEHLPDPLAFLKRARAWVAPDGVLVSTSALGLGEEFEPGNHDHLREWTLFEFARLHQKAGWVIVEAATPEVYSGRRTSALMCTLPEGK